MSKLSPSLLSANFYNLENDIEILYKNKIEYLHLDVMDGVFVNNISFGFPVIKEIKKHNDNFIMDAHFMIVEPDKYVLRAKEAGCDTFTFHYEATNKINDIIRLVHESGMKVGISIKPDTDVSVLTKYLNEIDLVLVMSVEPGFGGQKFIESSIEKIKFLKEYKEKNKLSYIIEIDGGINIENIKRVKDAGVDLIVAGSAVFKDDIDKNIKELNNKL